MKTCPLCGNPAKGNKEAKFLCTHCHVLIDHKMIGLFLGRFQPFHNGHLELIKNAAHEVEKLIIVIGSSLKHDTRENPFSADERKEMIEAALKQENIANYMIIPVNDILLDDEYVNHVRQFVPPFNIVYAGQNQLTAELFGEAGFGIRTSERIDGVEGAKIRKLILENKNWKEYIPPAVVEVIEKIDGVNRIRRLFLQG